MRNQYKVLAEKYEQVQEGDKPTFNDNIRDISPGLKQVTRTYYHPDGTPFRADGGQKHFYQFEPDIIVNNLASRINRLISGRPVNINVAIEEVCDFMEEYVDIFRTFGKHEDTEGQRQWEREVNPVIISKLKQMDPEGDLYDFYETISKYWIYDYPDPREEIKNSEEYNDVKEQWNEYQRRANKLINARKLSLIHI